MSASGSSSLGDHAVLALVAEHPRHGWAVARALAPGGTLGRVWTLSRPLVYRSIDRLAEQRLIRPARTEPGEGPRRTVYAATAAGRRELDRWLELPVEHLREVRTELLLKLVIGERAGRDMAPLLRRQREASRRIIAGLEKSASAPDADVVALWRRESARAVARFLDAAIDARRA